MEKPGGPFAQAETELPQSKILSKDAGPFFTFFYFFTFTFSHFCYKLIFIYKQPWTGLSSQSCLYFQGFLDSKLLNDCLVV